MIKRLIIFLIRRRLHLKKYQTFRFINQKNDNVYYFTKDKLVKIRATPNVKVTRHEKSLVSLNWLLSDDCKIKYVGWVMH